MIVYNYALYGLFMFLETGDTVGPIPIEFNRKNNFTSLKHDFAIRICREPPKHKISFLAFCRLSGMSIRMLMGYLL